VLGKRLRERRIAVSEDIELPWCGIAHAGNLLGIPSPKPLPIVRATFPAVGSWMRIPEIKQSED